MSNAKRLAGRVASLLGAAVLVTLAADRGGPTDAQAGGSCIAWRQTGQCAADGPRERQNDKACNVFIDSGWSGFCDCSYGRVGTGCGHPQRSCDQVCATGNWAPAPAAAPGGSCVAWRQTGGCAADGPREPQNDKACDVGIRSGWSGFCECSGGRVGVGCGHAQLSCDHVCAAGRWTAPARGCVAWRQTGRCAADGPREPQNDKACDVDIDSGWSGFCQCNGANLGVGCGHASKNCAEVCAGGSW